MLKPPPAKCSRPEVKSNMAIPLASSGRCLRCSSVDAQLHVSDAAFAGARAVMTSGFDFDGWEVEAKHMSYSQPPSRRLPRVSAAVCGRNPDPEHVERLNIDGFEVR